MKIYKIIIRLPDHLKELNRNLIIKRNLSMIKNGKNTGIKNISIKNSKISKNYPHFNKENIAKRKIIDLSSTPFNIYLLALNHRN